MGLDGRAGHGIGVWDGRGIVQPGRAASAEPAPSVVLMDFRESWASYAARYWLTDLLLDDPTDSVVRTRIAYALRRDLIRLAGTPVGDLIAHPEAARLAASSRVRFLPARRKPSVMTAFPSPRFW